MRSATLAYVVIGLWAWLPGDARACAGCRNPNMPITRVESVQLRPGEFRASASLGATSVHVTHAAGCAALASCTEQPIQPRYLHDQRLFPAEVRGIGELGLTAALGVEVQVPFRLVRTSIEYATPEGRPYAPLDPGIHHRDETLFGVGDSWLLGRWAGRIGGLLVSARAGASIPLGSTEPNPFALGDSGKRHQHIQFGSGTIDPVLSLDISNPVGRWVYLVYAQGQMSLYGNQHAFQAGTKASGGVQAGRRIWQAMTGAMGLEALYEGPERWDGEILQDGSLGRTEALLTVSLMQVFRAGSLGLSARVPFYRHIVTGEEPAGTFSSPLMLGLSGSRTFRVL